MQTVKLCVRNKLTSWWWQYQKEGSPCSGGGQGCGGFQAGGDGEAAR